jgi:hypothetical protein
VPIRMFGVADQHRTTRRYVGEWLDSDLVLAIRSPSLGGRRRERAAGQGVASPKSRCFGV